MFIPQKPHSFFISITCISNSAGTVRELLEKAPWLDLLHSPKGEASAPKESGKRNVEEKPTQTFLNTEFLKKQVKSGELKTSPLKKLDFEKSFNVSQTKHSWIQNRRRKRHQIFKYCEL